MRLGLREVYKVVASIIASPVISETKQQNTELGDIWSHSLSAAAAGQILAREKGDDPEIIFTTALLHDIGKVVLMRAGADEYTALLMEAKESGHSPLEAEKNQLRMTHSEVGALLLKRWNFPPNIIAAVQFHHRPAAAGEHARMAAYAHFSDFLARAIGHPYGPAEPNSPSKDAYEELDITESQLLALQYPVQQAFEKEKATFS